MTLKQKSYDNKLKPQAVNLTQEIGNHKVAQKLGISKDTFQRGIAQHK